MIDVYCDESRPETIFGSQGTDRYMVLGGIWIPRWYRDNMKSRIKELKATYGVNGEFKWKTVSPSKLDFYASLIDLFFYYPEVRFRCIVVDSWQVNMDLHDSDSELGFYKFYYQLLKHWLNDWEQYWIYLDVKKNRLPNRLHTLRDVLQNSTVGNVKSVQAIDSRQSVLTQMSDFLIGAVGYRYHGLAGSLAKVTVAERIEQYLGHRIGATAKSASKFNVFEIQLRGKY